MELNPEGWYVLPRGKLDSGESYAEVFIGLLTTPPRNAEGWLYQELQELVPLIESIERHELELGDDYSQIAEVTGRQLDILQGRLVINAWPQARRDILNMCADVMNPRRSRDLEGDYRPSEIEMAVVGSEELMDWMGRPEAIEAARAFTNARTSRQQNTDQLPPEDFLKNVTETEDERIAKQSGGEPPAAESAG